MYGPGQTAEVYAAANEGLIYKVEREYDGFKAEVSSHAIYMDALNRALEEGRSNSANYYAKVRIVNDGIQLFEKSFPPGWTSAYKGD